MCGHCCTCGVCTCWSDAISATLPIVVSTQSRGGKGSSTVSLAAGDQWGMSAGERAYVKQQVDYCCRPAWRAWRKTPLVAREARALKACEQLGLAVPKVLYFDAGKRAGTLVLAELVDHRPLDTAVAGASTPLRRRLLERTGRYIGLLHRAGWYHGALYAHHILISPDGEPRLIDFEKARRSRRRRTEDLDRFWRHNQFLNDDDKAAILAAYQQALNT